MFPPFSVINIICLVVVAMADTDATDVFVYTGIGEGAIVPEDVVRVRIDPSVLVLPGHAFSYRLQLK